MARRRGRPSLQAGVRSVEVFTHVTEPDRVALQSIAAAERSTVAAVVRTAVRQFIRSRGLAAVVVPVDPPRQTPRPTHRVIKRGL